LGARHPTDPSAPHVEEDHERDQRQEAQVGGGAEGHLITWAACRCRSKTSATGTAVLTSTRRPWLARTCSLSRADRAPRCSAYASIAAGSRSISTSSPVSLSTKRTGPFP